MCGIAGVWTMGGGAAAALERMAGVMIDRLRHRGPDDRGVWVDAAAGIALANRRLAVVDLSPAGHQPMISGDGAVTLAFNGEIYNHTDLRARLIAQGVVLRSHSDTEVLLEAIAHWGLDAALRAAHGMFALAVWFKAARRLVLVRDRLGEKPLYWRFLNGQLHFASELKAVTAVLDAPPSVDRRAMAEFFRRGHIPAPLTAYEGIGQLPPGCLLTLDDGNRTPPTPQRYWSAVGTLPDRPVDLPDAAVLDLARDLITRSVTRIMTADVPLGVFLSGGVDSALVAALMQAHSPTPVRSYTIGFEETGRGEGVFDESAAAAAVAAHLGTHHQTLMVGVDAVRDLLPQLPGMYDEPFADASALPVALLCRLARAEVTVALTGDGGDEGYAGYTRHAWAPRLARWRANPAWRGAARALAGLPLAPLDDAARLLRSDLRQPADKLGKLLAAIGAASDADAHIAVLGQWGRLTSLLADPPPPPLALAADLEPPPGIDPALALQLRDIAGYLPDGVLTKVDRASMAASLETRAPLLDHDVVAFGLSLPAHQRVRDGKGKWVLRRLLAAHLPESHGARPKTGFGLPLGQWLRGPLRDWGETLLAADTLRRDGMLRPDTVRRLWAEHASGRHEHGGRLWTILSYLSWRETTSGQ